MTALPPDPYTMDLRLCDDAGLVSAKRIVDASGSLDRTYLDRFKRLRRLGGEPYDGAAFTCTGSAHVLPGEHIRCTSPAHRAVTGSYLVNGRVYRPEDVTPVYVQTQEEYMAVPRRVMSEIALALGPGRQELADAVRAAVDGRPAWPTWS